MTRYLPLPHAALRKKQRRLRVAAAAAARASNPCCRPR